MRWNQAQAEFVAKTLTSFGFVCHSGLSESLVFSNNIERRKQEIYVIGGTHKTVHGFYDNPFHIHFDDDKGRYVLSVVRGPSYHWKVFELSSFEECINQIVLEYS